MAGSSRISFRDRASGGSRSGRPSAPAPVRDAHRHASSARRRTGSKRDCSVRAAGEVVALSCGLSQSGGGECGKGEGDDRSFHGVLLEAMKVWETSGSHRLLASSSRSVVDALRSMVRQCWSMSRFSFRGTASAGWRADRLSAPAPVRDALRHGFSAPRRSGSSGLLGATRSSAVGRCRRHERIRAANAAKARAMIEIFMVFSLKRMNAVGRCCPASIRLVATSFSRSVVDAFERAAGIWLVSGRGVFAILCISGYADTLRYESLLSRTISAPATA